MRNKSIKLLFQAIVYLFAIAGFVLIAGYFAVKWGATDTKGIIDVQREEFLKSSAETAPNPVWAEGEEWQVFKEAVLKDKETLAKVESETGISARLLVSILAVEQLRLFHTNREVFKKAFYPLKILGNQSQFSWGVMGLKQDTAVEVEIHLKNPASEFYLGEAYENLLDFKTADHDRERFQRITDPTDRYYSYLYAAFLIKQMERQWEKAGFHIEEKVDILATLFNIGFKHSKPNASPLPGGSEIIIGEKAYSFGSLASEIYFSSELLSEFPRK